MKLPRDLDAPDLVRGLKRMGYISDRQSGSHIALTFPHEPEHHVTIPNHRPIKVGTLSGILKAVAARHEVTVEQLLHRLGL